MTYTYDKITYEEWYKTYRPVREQTFDSYGVSGEFVESQDPARVWTYISTGDGDYIKSGFHSCDRIGYLITEIPCTSDIEIWVELTDADIA